MVTSTISIEQLKRAVSVREQIETLELELAAILGDSSKTPSPAASNGKHVRRKMSAAARAKIGAAQKARWAKQKKSAVVVKKRRKMSAASRAKIAAAARARWAAAKAANRKTLARG